MITNKRGSGTMTGVILSLLAVMALFYGTFDYVSTNYDSANVSERLGYNQSRLDLETAQANLSSDIEEIEADAKAVGEADGNIITVAWNGLTGLAATIRAFFGIIDVAVTVWNAVLPGLVFLPEWSKLLIEMGLVIWIVLIIIGALKGEAKT